ncbi:MAG TPA: sodium/proton-translocating pyrophosphatase, partial [Pyrinomonadaceae bacterium]|nr:sodium/proton-translocating pyrophosphatase [Pyrinomonadaceae bacterium]
MELPLIFAVSLLSLGCALYLIRKVLQRGTSVQKMPGVLDNFMRDAEALARPLSSFALRIRRGALTAGSILVALVLNTSPALAAPETGTHAPGGEANLVLPDLASQQFLGTDGHTLLLVGLGVCVLGLLFGLVIFMQLKNLPVHRAMKEISELIYETCKTYLVTQGKFILLLWVFIGIIVAIYFGALTQTINEATGAIENGFPPLKVLVIILFSLVGIAGSYGVAWFGIRVNTFANSRTAFASLGGKPYPIYAIPLKAGMSIGMMLISVELLIMLCILLFIPRDYAGACFIGFAIGESLGAAALR